MDEKESASTLQPIEPHEPEVELPKHEPKIYVPCPCCKGKDCPACKGSGRILFGWVVLE